LPVAGLEFSVGLAVYLRSGQIGREKIGCELNSFEIGVYRAGQDRHGHCLGQARDAFQQYMPVGQQSYQHAF
jgi:hypothetical protein